MKNKALKYLLILFMCTVLTCTIGACSKDGYKQITINNELGHYSFEYPSYYDKNFMDNFNFRVPYATLALEGDTKIEEVELLDPATGKIKTVSGERGTAIIYIGVSNYKVEFGEAYSATDVIEGTLRAEARWQNFKLLERAPVTVSGIEGERIVYLVDKLMPIPVEDGKNLEYVCGVFFDYNGFTWKIESKCNQEIQDQVRADFDHIVASFQILDQE